MKAIVQNDYGSPSALSLKEVAKPAVEDNDVLVRVRAASVNSGDYFSMKGEPWIARLSVGFPKPKDYIPGWDLAGHVEQVAKQVTGFKPGDEVFGACQGCFTEYACADPGKLALKPGNLTFEQAAAIPTAALTALQGLRDAGHVQEGQKILVNGAAGGVGTFAVQIAKSFGAEVTGVCSTKNVDMVLSIGADYVIDYTKEDFTQSGPRFDLILDNVANHSFSDLRRALTPEGVIVPNSGHAGIGYVIKAFVLSMFVHQVGRPYVASENSQDLVVLKELIEAGKITPVIDQTYPLSKAPAALSYIGKGHARGKVVITI